jgi:hypothetical protein
MIGYSNRATLDLALTGAALMKLKSTGTGGEALGLQPLSSAVITIISPIPSLGWPLGVLCHGLKQWQQ